MNPLTLYLARFMGLSLLLMCGALAARPKAAVEAMTGRSDLLLVTGVITMFGGVALVVGHNVWNGGALALVVTVLGWITLIKGVVLIAAPPAALGAFYRALHYPERFRAMMLAGCVGGALLTAAAFWT